ncbi:hypothetical protein IE53DRAFT_383135 [Violaceomyces palustris]|uniref:Uncharacterized protein n=1 Tax=Violaceomyces palustris TaxID=1673888 RepID=A0ACD0P8B7_9BASI|nr:hypothetical protein IE53DRAFT_383135 [Violaceomyces palustris]
MTWNQKETRILIELATVFVAGFDGSVVLGGVLSKRVGTGKSRPLLRGLSLSVGLSRGER